MPSETKSTTSASSKSAQVPTGMETAINSILAGYTPRENSATESGDLMRQLTNADPKDVEKLVEAIQKNKISDDELAKVDFSKIKVKKDSIWVMQLCPDGFATPDGKFADSFEDGYKPLFSIIVYDEKSAFRLVEQPPEPGMPKSDFILASLKRAIVRPTPPLVESLPTLLIITLKLSPHIPALRPFLNSLPAPFEWRLETQEEASEVADGIFEMNEQGVSVGIQIAENEKAAGNKAMASKDRDTAVKHYTEAIECLLDAKAQNPDGEDLKKVTALFSVCFANRAAAWLLEGEGQDPKKALEDALQAITFDEDYAKAYWRAATSHVLLLDKKAALELLARGLQRPALARDKALNDLLVNIHGGNPKTKDELRTFCLEVFRRPGATRGLKEFERRVNEQVHKVFGKSVSIDSL